MISQSYIKRLLPALLFVLTCTLYENDLRGHAGHSHGPEPEAPKVADVAPRFYGQSDWVEAVLTFSNDDKQDPVLYFARKTDNSPIAAAKVTAEPLAGLNSTLQVVEGTTSGSYVLKGIGWPETTVSLMLEVTKGDINEIISMDNILPEAEAVAADEAAASTKHDAGTILGLPRYLVYALIAMNAVLVSVVVLAFLIWVGKMLYRRKSLAREARAEAHKLPSGAAVGKMPLAIAAASLLTLTQNREALAHAGEDHSGASLAAPAIPGSGSRHFLAIDAQFEGDVRTTQVVEQTLPKSFRALGQVEIRPDQKAVVTPPVEGKLLPGAMNNGRIPVQGDQVSKGQVLVIVEQIIPAAEKVTLTTERAEVEAELSQAKQELALASRERERTDRLANVVAAKEVDEARAAERIARDKVNGLGNRLQTLTSALTAGGGANVRQVPVVSPISGTISESHSVLGEYVQSDKTLFQIVNVEEVFVGADVFETDLGVLQNAKTARITLEAFPNEAFSGTLHSVGQEINRETRSAHVLFAVSNPDLKLRGGMFANIQIESGTSRTALVVPKGAVLSQDGIRQVFTKVAPETFQAQMVTVSEFRENVAVLTEGVKAGDQIAISGLYQISKAPTVPAPVSAVATEGGAY